MRTFSIGTIILAAGNSLRMGSPKPLLKLDQQTFLECVIQTHKKISSEICIVLGNLSDEIQSKLDLDGLILLRNHRPELGPLSSIQIGLEALDGVSGVIIHPVDHPRVSRITTLALKEAHTAHPECILIPRFEGKRGHPVLFPSMFFPELHNAPLEKGARWVVRKNLDSVLQIDVRDPGVLININTSEDYKRLSLNSEAGFLRP